MGRVAGPQEVGVQRVDLAALHRAGRGHQCLPGHLAAEHALAVLVVRAAPEEVDLDGFEVEDPDDLVERSAHR